MNIELKYFTGTGNSLKILNTCREVFEQNKHIVRISRIKLNEKCIEESDIIGFCFPVYVFGIPRICRNYLNKIEKFKNKQKIFVLITAGDSDESGFSVKECEKILLTKNCEIIYTEVVQMPINWITSPSPPFNPPKEEALEIIKNGINQAKKISLNILNGNKLFHIFNYPKRFSKFKFYKDYLLFKYLGIRMLWRAFRVYNTCNGCQICSKICPTNSIKIIEKKPVWESTCEQCMRCANFCPKNAIYQLYGGDTNGKNRYYEPSFNPYKQEYI